MGVGWVQRRKSSELDGLTRVWGVESRLRWDSVMAFLCRGLELSWKGNEITGEWIGVGVELGGLTVVSSERVFFYGG